MNTFDPNYLRTMYSIKQSEHPERLFVVGEIGDPKDKIILDIGCGNHKSLPEAVGIDVFKGAEVEHVITDHRLPFDKESVDFIISRHSFEHMLDQVSTILEWTRVLKHGGKIAMVLPDHEKVNTMHPDFASTNFVHVHAYTKETLGNVIMAIDRDQELFIEKSGECIPGWSFYMVIRKN